MNTGIRDNENALRTGGIAIASQATNDIPYATSATQFGRIANPADATQFLNGANPPAYAVPPGLGTVRVFTDNFSVAARWSADVGGGGVNTFATLDGGEFDTSATISSWAGGYIRFPGSADAYALSPQFSISLNLSAIGTDVQVFVGIARISGASSVDYTSRHIGFKITRAASGAINLYATQGNGTTETASAALTTVAANDQLELYFKANGTASVDYYWRKNSGALSSATNLATNYPVATILTQDNRAAVTIGNAGVATQSTLYVNNIMVVR